MNKVELMGRLTRDVEIRYTTSDTPIAIGRFSIAVNRTKSKEDAVDFINCVAFGKTAEFVNKYFSKGKMIALTGRIQVNPFTDKDGNKRTSTDVVAEEIFFTGEKADAKADVQDNLVEDNFDDDLPF